MLGVADCVTEAEPEEEGVPEGVGLDVADCVPEVELEDEEVSDCVMEGEGVLEEEELVVGVSDCVAETETDADGVSDPDDEALELGVHDPEELLEEDTVSVELAVPDGDTEAEGVVEREEELDEVELAVVDGVIEAVEVSESDREAEALVVAEDVSDGVLVLVCVAEGVQETKSQLDGNESTGSRIVMFPGVARTIPGK